MNTAANAWATLRFAGLVMISFLGVVGSRGAPYLHMRAVKGPQGHALCAAPAVELDAGGDVVVLQEAHSVACVRGMLLAGDRVGYVCMYDLPQQPRGGRLSRVRHVRAHNSFVNHMLLLPDGRTLATATEQRAVRLWSVGWHEHAEARMEDPPLVCAATLEVGSPCYEMVAAGNVLVVGGSNDPPVFRASLRRHVMMLDSCGASPYRMCAAGDSFWACTSAGLFRWREREPLGRAMRM